jgi:hypothetical protein
VSPAFGAHIDYNAQSTDTRLGSLLLSKLNVAPIVVRVKSSFSEGTEYNRNACMAQSPNDTVCDTKQNNQDYRNSKLRQSSSFQRARNTIGIHAWRNLQTIRYVLPNRINQDYRNSKLRQSSSFQRARNTIGIHAWRDLQTIRYVLPNRTKPRLIDESLTSSCAVY